MEAAAQGCKSNTNPLWAPILWTIKTKGSAAAAAAVPAGHKTLGKHPERAANQLAGWGTTQAETVCRQGGGPPLQVDRWRLAGVKIHLKDWKLGRCEAQLRGHTRPAPGNGALAKKATNKAPLHGRELELARPAGGVGGRDFQDVQERDRMRKGRGERKRIGRREKVGGGRGEVRKREKRVRENWGEGKMGKGGRERDWEKRVRKAGGAGGWLGRERKERQSGQGLGTGGSGQGRELGSVPTGVGAGCPLGWMPGGPQGAAGRRGLGRERREGGNVD